MTVLVSSSSAEYAANISPDGRYFAYQSDESGGFEVYVKPYPRVGQARWQISMGGGRAPVWARSGGELFYLDGSNRLMAVPVQTSGTQFKSGKPAKLFETAYSSDFYSYDVSPDGQRFLMMKQSEAGDRMPSNHHGCRPQLARGTEEPPGQVVTPIAGVARGDRAQSDCLKKGSRSKYPYPVLNG